MTEYTVTAIRYQMGDHLSAEEQTQAAIEFVAALKIGQPVLLAAGLCLAGYRAAMLSGEDSLERREEIVSQFRARKINYLCVVDIYNEGVDIPEIDTVLFGCYTREEQLAIFDRRTAEKSWCHSSERMPESGRHQHRTALGIAYRASYWIRHRKWQ